jgi:asparagine synthase (glutamine-hydrolysing)
MSGLYGIVDFSGAPIDPGVLHAMSTISEGLGPDGSSRKLFLGAALGHLSLLSTPEALTEQQPVCARSGSVCLVADVRLDNRQELIDRLRSHGLLEEPAPGDATLLLAAYLLWGTSCPEHLLGDFAFAVWDAPQRLLFCVRDPLGVKPLHYARIGSLVCFASEAQQVLQHPSVPRRLDEQTLADYLAGTWDNPDRTFFRDVHRLPAAHSRVFTVGGDRMERYWDIDPGRRITYRDDRDYTAHFLDLFQRAVANRLRAPEGPVGILMSGGLDSTSVAAMMRRSIPRGGNRDLFSCSFVFPHLRQCDERTYIEATAEELAMDTELVDAEKLWLLGDPEAYQPRLETPLLAWESPFDEVLRRTRSRNARVLLTGHGGDDLMAGSLLVYADLLLQGDLRVLLETIPHAAAQGWSGWRTLYRYFGQPLIPSVVDRTVRRFLGKPPRPMIPEWIRPEFVRRSGLAERLHSVPARPVRTAAWHELYDEVVQLRGWERAVHWYTSKASPFGIEVRHPFLDRRLVELMLAIPSRLRSQPGCYKPFLRRAIEGLLPERVRTRTDKTALCSFFYFSLRQRERCKIEKLLAAPLADEMKILDAAKLREAYRAWQEDSTPESLGLWPALTFEIWLRKFVDQIDEALIPRLETVEPGLRFAHVGL